MGTRSVRIMSAAANTEPDPASVTPSRPALRGVADLDAADLGIEELGSRIVGLAGRVAAATSRWLMMVAQFDARGGCATFGLASTAHWLTHACGISHRTAVEHVRVARALVAFPELSGALESGRISFCHARAITRVAREGEDQLISDLVGVAENGTVGQLETVVRGLRTVDDNQAAEPAEPGGQAVRIEPRAVAAEYVRHGWASQTSHWRLSARLDPERGALVEHAVAAVADAEGITHADALVRLGEIALAALSHSGDGPPRTLRGHERAAVLIHLDAAAVPPAAGHADSVTATTVRDRAKPAPEPLMPKRLVPRGSRARSRERAATDDRPFAWLQDGPGLPREVVERLLCACRVRPVVHDPDGSVLDLGRTKRVVDDRLYRALLLRDRQCTYPGCTSRHKIEAHHVVHWLHGGRTDMANLTLLCERHHHAHHDGEFAISTLGPSRRGEFEFTLPDGRTLERHIDPSRFIDPDLPPVETDFAAIPDAAIRSRTVGDRLDRAWAIAVLAGRRRAA